MKLTAVLASLLITVASYADTPSVLVDLGVADPATPRTYAVEAGTFNIKLLYAIPNKTYEILGDKIPSSLQFTGDAAQKPTCSPTDANAKAIYALFVANKQKTDANAKDLTEAELKTAFAALDCNALLTAATTQYDADKKAFDTANAVQNKTDDEKKRLKTEEDRLAAIKTELDAAVKKPDDLRNKFNVPFPTFRLTAGESLQKTFKAVGEDTTWTAVVTTQGGSAATTAVAAAKAANPVAAESVNLNRLLGNTSSHPDLIVGTCKYDDTNPCAAKLYVNSDQISTLTINNIPKGAATVRITAGEHFKCEAADYNIVKYKYTPDTIIFPLVMKRNIWEFFGVREQTHDARARSMYHLTGCPGDKPEKAENAGASNSDKKGEENASILDPRLVAVEPPSIASLPIYIQGDSEVLEVEFEWEDHTFKTFTLPIYYQRFWLDAGGFFAFARRTDQSIDLEPVPDKTPEEQKVRAIRRDVSVEAATGIVINIHPGNYPYFAFQFGIAANQGKLPSYYGGIGLRAREIGKRGLATIAVGVAMQQEQRYPNVFFGETYLSTSPLLKGSMKYGLTFPYVSISLGFSFGGVSEKTNVADRVTAPAQ